MKNRSFILKISGVFLGIIALASIYSVKSNAEGTNPITLSAIESTGVIKYQTDVPVEFYTSDLVNLKNEINSLGIYTDEQLTSINTHIDALISEVSEGKRNIAGEMNTYGASIPLTGSNIPTWTQLKNGIKPVYDNGFNIGYDEGYEVGYEEGEEAGVTVHGQTYIIDSRASNIDLGELHEYRYVDTTGVPNSNDDTYKPTARSTSIDMGATNTYRYVDTSSVPNTNSATYTYPANSTGGKVDLGSTNTYRYVNASNVYNKGKVDGKSAISYSDVQVILGCNNSVYDKVSVQVYINGTYIGWQDYGDSGHASDKSSKLTLVR